MIIGVDIDGCLSDFNTGFKKVVVATTGKDLFGENWTPDGITTWNYTKDQYGYTPDEDKAAWEAVKTSPSFWYDLPPLEGTFDFLQSLSGDFIEDVYFITTRMGKHVKVQTEEWLFTNGYRDVPTVLISGDKAGCCRALNITHYLDDKNENCQAVSVTNTKCYMLAKPWNEKQEAVPRIPNLQEFLEVLKAERGGQ